ncbi:hypothetical protein P171DRAFT_412346 [Karstenula rhodostoma CBS 690.94]|uniref:Uncharacterized protein n=1 Tax=Karstenula rhodostoma CBS 690.94 TaxID=1392251 RepID=A0A9P4UBW8_9PLEO|nr:hypothetical protein P171DRAFT_412346 [Karstenula rhodostoma CBS 690.94]
MNLSAFRPVLRPANASKYPIANALRPNAALQRTVTPATASPFSSTSRMMKRKKGKGPGTDPRITAIRYHLSHPLTPRPLHFSRLRALRHWTIHRAWLLFLRRRRWAEERDLERQYQAMRSACEHLRLMDANGNLVSEAEAGGQGADPGVIGSGGKEVGRLYRAAMLKRGVWGSVPVEYARAQVDFPGREGWNHAWTRD